MPNWLSRFFSAHTLVQRYQTQLREMVVQRGGARFSKALIGGIVTTIALMGQTALTHLTCPGHSSNSDEDMEWPCYLTALALAVPAGVLVALGLYYRTRTLLSRLNAWCYDVLRDRHLSDEDRQTLARDFMQFWRVLQYIHASADSLDPHESTHLLQSTDVIFAQYPGIRAMKDFADVHLQDETAVASYMPV